MTCESVACRSYFTNKSFRAVCADLWYVCACVYKSSEASAYSFGLATNPTRARRYPLNINPKPDSISGPAGSGRVADLYVEVTISSDENGAYSQMFMRHNFALKLNWQLKMESWLM